MRGIYSSVTDIRRRVFTEIARLSYEGGDLAELARLPYAILPGEVGTYRESIFLERAIVSERLRGKLRDALIYSDVYGSDHCPVGLVLDT